MKVSVNPIQRITDVVKITKTAHGLTLPVGYPLMAIYVDNVTGDFLPADASALATTRAMFVTEILDVDTIEVQSSGYIKYTGHGLAIGEYYFVTDAGDGGFSSTPGTFNDIAFYVVDANHLLLQEKRPV